MTGGWQHWHRDLRVEGPRRELLQGRPRAKVMDVALRCGFPHFGRFSVGYRRRYGETPSQTLKRQALFVAALAVPHLLFVSGVERPSLALRAIEAGPENGEIARGVADDLTMALTRAGVSVIGDPK